MKIEFNPLDYDEKREMTALLASGNYHSILWDIKSEIRNVNKYDKSYEDFFHAVEILINEFVPME